MKVAWRLVEADAYERARKQALTRRPGKPTRTDWIMWQKQLKVIVAGYESVTRTNGPWTQPATTTDAYSSR